MEIRVKRTIKTKRSTTGVLSILGSPFTCFTLEDTDRGLQASMCPAEILATKVDGQTAIPAGRYEVAITMSTRFNKELPLLLAVPGFSGIRIHAGNTAADTAGCLLVGKDSHLDRVGRSREAFGELDCLLRQALHHQEKIFINIL